MSRRRESARRSAGEWGVRGLLSIGACVLGYQAVLASRGQVLAASDPAAANAADPGSGQIAGLRARQMFAAADATASDRARADRLARRALAREPLSIAAVTTIGLNAQMRGDPDPARRSLVLALQLSRRDLTTGLWAIEDAVDRGDIRTAVRHYDIILRTSKLAPDLLYPILAGALSEPAVRSAIADTLAMSPPWAIGFVGHAASHGPSPEATAALLTELHRRGIKVDESADTAVVSGLVNQGRIDRAWSYYASFRRGADRRRSRDASFRHNPDLAAVFDWTPLTDAGIAVSIQPGANGGIVDFAAPTSVGGRVIEQAQMLPPGRYRLEGRSASIEQLATSLPYWSLSCRGSRELGRVDVPNAPDSGGTFAGAFIVPLDCPMQVLTLAVRPSDAIDGSTGQIHRAELRPAG